ncbi:MAG: hypothetical protein WAP23_03840 [Candidatus Spechtbacterales bacterium]
MNLVYSEDPYLEGCEATSVNVKGTLPACVDIVEAYCQVTRPEVLGPSRSSGTAKCRNGCHSIHIVDRNLNPSGAEIRVYEN